MQVFQQKKAGAGKSFQHKAEETLARLAAAPASDVEVTHPLTSSFLDEVFPYCALSFGGAVPIEPLHKREGPC